MGCCYYEQPLQAEYFMPETNAAGQITGCGSRNGRSSSDRGGRKVRKKRIMAGCAACRAGKGDQFGGAGSQGLGELKEELGTWLRAVEQTVNSNNEVCDTTKDFCSKPQKSFIGGAIHGN